MKKAFSALLIAGFSLLFSQSSFGQARLHIVEIDSFPVFPGDTAFEGQPYHNISIKVSNVGSNNFFGEIDVFLYSQSIGISGIDTLRDDPLHQNFFIPPGDTVTTDANPNYTFRSAHYDAGDNIIVVWPYFGSTDFDTYDSRVFFVPTLTGIHETKQASLNIFPNPVTRILYLNYGSENTVEQVRIFDPEGKEIFHYPKAVNTIDFSGCDRGLYFLELIRKDGTRSIKKIVVTEN